MEIIKSAKAILNDSGSYSIDELLECINDLVNSLEYYTYEDEVSEKTYIQNLAIEIIKESKLIDDKLDRKEIENPTDVLEALRQTPIVLLTEKYSDGQFSGIDQYQYKYNGLVYTFVLEGTYIIEAYTENEIN